jgi:hypothetical protein
LKEVNPMRAPKIGAWAAGVWKRIPRKVRVRIEIVLKYGSIPAVIAPFVMLFFDK